MASLAAVVIGGARRMFIAPAPSATAVLPPAAPAVPLVTESASASAAAALEPGSCSVDDRGDGGYQPLPLTCCGSARLLVPAPRPSESFTLVVHLHGGEAARKLVAPAGLGVVLALIDAGTGSMRYDEALYGPEPFAQLLQEVELALRPARAAHVIVTSWSAGFGGVRQILWHHPERVDAVVLLDGLHASYDPATGGPKLVELEPFVTYAERARDGEARMVLTHSEIRPPGYASSGEAVELVRNQVGGQKRYAGLEPFEGVAFKTELREGGLLLRGTTGTGPEAHCAHLKMLPAILRDEVLPALGR